MTLVFAKDKTEEAVKEALIAGRTACYFDNYLVVRQQEAEPFFKAAVSATAIKSIKKDEPILLVKLFNNSDVPFKVQVSGDFILDKYPMGQLTLDAHKETVLILRSMWKYPDQIAMKINVTNMLINADASLHTVLTIKP